MSRHLHVQIVNPNCAYVSGYGARDLITELRHGRPPVWSTLGCAWVTTPRTARDLICLAEGRHYEVTVTVTDGDPVDLSGGRLW